MDFHNNQYPLSQEMGGHGLEMASGGRLNPTLGDEFDEFQSQFHNGHSPESYESSDDYQLQHQSHLNMGDMPEIDGVYRSPASLHGHDDLFNSAWDLREDHLTDRATIGGDEYHSQMIRPFDHAGELNLHDGTPMERALELNNHAVRDIDTFSDSELSLHIGPDGGLGNRALVAHDPGMDALTDLMANSSIHPHAHDRELAHLPHHREDLSLASHEMYPHHHQDDLGIATREMHPHHHHHQGYLDHDPFMNRELDLIDQPGIYPEMLDPGYHRSLDDYGGYPLEHGNYLGHGHHHGLHGDFGYLERNYPQIYQNHLMSDPYYRSMSSMMPGAFGMMGTPLHGHHHGSMMMRDPFMHGIDHDFGYGRIRPLSQYGLSRSALQPGYGQGLDDLYLYEMMLRADRELDEQERMRRWRQRLQWEELSEAERRLRWKQMSMMDRSLLGLGSGSYWGHKFGGMPINNSFGYVNPMWGAGGYGAGFGAYGIPRQHNLMMGSSTRPMGFPGAGMGMMGMGAGVGPGMVGGYGLNGMGMGMGVGMGLHDQPHFGLSPALMSRYPMWNDGGLGLGSRINPWLGQAMYLRPKDLMRQQMMRRDYAERRGEIPPRPRIIGPGLMGTGVPAQAYGGMAAAGRVPGMGYAHAY